MFRRFFLCFARPSQPQRSIQDMGQNEQATTKIVLDRLIRIVYPKETTSQNDEHDETKRVQQKWFRKVCATYHPIFAANAHACGKALNYFFLGQLSQSSQSTAIPSNYACCNAKLLFECRIRPFANWKGVQRRLHFFVHSAHGARRTIAIHSHPTNDCTMHSALYNITPPNLPCAQRQ